MWFYLPQNWRIRALKKNDCLTRKSHLPTIKISGHVFIFRGDMEWFSEKICLPIASVFVGIVCAGFDRQEARHGCGCEPTWWGCLKVKGWWQDNVVVDCWVLIVDVALCFWIKYIFWMWYAYYTHRTDIVALLLLCNTATLEDGGIHSFMCFFLKPFLSHQNPTSRSHSQVIPLNQTCPTNGDSWDWY